MVTVQNATVQNNRSAEMENVPVVLSSRDTEWHYVTTRNNRLNKQLKDIMEIVLYRSYNYKLILQIILRSFTMSE